MRLIRRDTPPQILDQLTAVDAGKRNGKLIAYKPLVDAALAESA